MRAVLLLIATTLLAASIPRGYEAEVRKWRQDYESRLKKENGWLALAGLFWLKEGVNSFGSALGNDIVLPAGAPPSAGTFILRGDKTLLRAREGVNITLNGKPVQTEMELKPDSAGSPDQAVIGHLAMIAIQRGKRHAIRLWDNASPNRTNFAGVQWFPVSPAWRIEAKWVAYPQPKQIPILNILGDTEPSPSPGYAVFAAGGRECRLEPLLEDDTLFFLFKDLTSGHQTYAAGRFLYADPPRDGKVVLDFNKAYSPPCAFTPYATCPLPPKQNYLPIAIEAGAMDSGHHKAGA